MSRSLIAERLEEALFQIQAALTHPSLIEDETIQDEVERLRDVVEELEDAIEDIVETLADDREDEPYTF